MNDQWPSLPLAEWKDTYETLHMWTQIAGKIRLTQMPWINHSWHVPLYVSARGLTTLAIPHGTRTFQLDFDFIAHQFVIQVSDGTTRSIALRPMTVAEFYGQVMLALQELNLPVAIHARPNEVMDAIPFAQDDMHAAYDAEYSSRFWHVLAQSERVFEIFRARFIGKNSPVHFFWGSFDLTVSRFSGRKAPPHPGGVPNFPDRVAREAYSHEVCSGGFWPGGGGYDDAAFYAYVYPEPPGFSSAPMKPSAAFYSETLHEFLLPYAIMREASSPDQMLLDFLQTTYEAAANNGYWDRAALEKADGEPL